MNIRRIIGLASVPALALSGLLITAGAASAGDGGNPCESPSPGVSLTAFYGGHKPCPTPSVTTPAPTPTQFTPPPRRHFHFRQEDFEIEVSSLRPNGEVLADGPIVLNVGQDHSVNPFLDVLSQGPNSVNIHHEGLVGAQIDLQTCTITVDENDLPWTIFRGTGLYRGALGFGHYTLRGIFSFPTYRGFCSLPKGLSIDSTQDLGTQLANDNLKPVYYDVAVQGTGFATLFRHVPCHRSDQVPPIVRAGTLTG